MWLTRDSNGCKGYDLHMGPNRPKKRQDGQYFSSDAYFNSKEFHKRTKGMRLRPGQCREIEKIVFIPIKE